MPISSTPRLGVLILAAGASRRLGQSKQLVLWQGQPLVRRAAQLALGLEPARCVVVLGAETLAVATALEGLPVARVVNADWESGMASSLQAGIAALADCAGVLIMTCDQYRVTATDLRELVALWRRNPGSCAASRYAGTCGIPAIISRRLTPTVAGLSGEQGLKHILSGDEDCRYLELAHAAFDLDTPHDLEELMLG